MPPLKGRFPCSVLDFRCLGPGEILTSPNSEAVPLRLRRRFSSLPLLQLLFCCSSVSDEICGCYKIGGTRCTAVKSRAGDALARLDVTPVPLRLRVRFVRAARGLLIR